MDRVENLEGEGVRAYRKRRKKREILEVKKRGLEKKRLKGKKS